MMNENNNYQFLEPRPRSNYRQLWIKDRRIRAEILYRMTVGPEPRTPEEVAADFDVPVEAVRESVDYCQRNKDLLDGQRAREDESIRRMGLDQPPYVPSLETKDA